ncbi:hypothetical protein ACE1OC_15630 [Streptomyces sp. DSM 116496]|uniref:hypothetical protein n=1 Tax=Streptomyces stoeckheimensis TaxID=3344656 RepID=UPI0038B3C85B
MLAVLIRMIPAPDAEKARSGVVEEVVWATAEPQDGLEHLTVVDDAEGRFGLMAFMSAVDKVRATTQARKLIDRAVRRAGALRGWSVVECSAVDLSRESSSGVGLIAPQGTRIFDM